jgi:DNA-binding response OmpR family regulator
VRVLVVYGDPVVGQALSLLLEGGFYTVEPMAQSVLEEPGGRSSLLGKEIELFVFAFDLDAGRSESLLRWLKSRPETANVPIIVLGTPSWSPKLDADYYVPWPIRTEELKDRIGAVLAASRGVLPGKRSATE